LRGDKVIAKKILVVFWSHPISGIMAATVWWWVLYTARCETVQVSPSAANV